MKITDLKPEIVWKFFHQVTQVPRPSKKEGKMIEFLESFAKQYKIAIKKDAVGNILMSKPATPGKESLPTVVLQSHMDMVCEKNNGTAHDFDNDPIETIVDGDWLRANGTTLGADNGIGVAAELAILASDDIEHGPIECLFTIDEETGLTGAKALEKGFMTGDILLNLDSEDEGEIFMGCAGGKDTQAVFHYESQPTNPNMQYFIIDVKGLNGGHSGGEIHKGLGNANKVLVRYLYLLGAQVDFTLCSISGGNLRNAIAREAHAVIGLSPNEKETARVLLNHYTADIENELKHVDPNVRISMESTEQPEKCIGNAWKDKVIWALHACPHGVIGMSHDIEGLVETSTNLASVKMGPDDTIIVGTSQRSSIESCKNMIANQVASVFKLADAVVTHGDGYPGWAPNPDSKILKVAQETYKRLFNKDAKIMAIHAGLECGLFLEKYPNLDMISFGPTLLDVHSPNERIQIDTVGLWWSHLLELLKSIPAK
ncbi:aminoacyl-histidine dipeptidase [Parabacteroides acidifaciens]|uniref:Cytosol non-specific dipeptidase n=1 Tax=Parabacteroides acidifaciens TaxID=2290935 RepID=A0A3D8HDE0_9BACT|nr:aminoacyl-histidine dipeptidase [Parabacteroides acidifaciens]MBC8602348.1 aminoacyl-histidine dipeptidase [Parabacteroides acidifaciens]RDU48966.1 aminoacyl-histidine dipeptidase [Parabacteroides acidifaciens]